MAARQIDVALIVFMSSAATFGASAPAAARKDSR
jgi:hypothetical protein